MEVFPYELFFIPFWFIVLILQLYGSSYREPLGLLLLVFSMLATYIARNEYKQSLKIKSISKFKQINCFLKSIFDVKYRNELKLRKQLGQKNSKEK